MLWGMGWQEWVALTIVALTAAAFAGSRLRLRKVPWARRAPCGCAAGSRFLSRGSVTFRARKGARAEVVVRMK